MQEKPEEQVEQRRKKLEGLKELGINPYPNDFAPAHQAAEVQSAHAEQDAEALEGVDTCYRLAGRVMALRLFGKAAFIKIADRSGAIQAYLQQNVLGEDSYGVFKKFVEVGDIVGIEGSPMRTRTGELSIHAASLQLLTKSVRPLPEKWHGLTDVEIRYRRRYVDLIANREVMELFILRSRIVKYLRSFLDNKGFLEVETPMMHVMAGGANARPFVTHHKTLDMEMYLRIALELYHKRLIVGGLDRVYEIGRIFRNEGLSRRHNPEFTMLELYQAYADYNDIMVLVEEMFASWCKTVLKGHTTVTWDGHEIDLAPPFPRKPFLELIREHSGIDTAALDDGELEKALQGVGVKTEGKVGRGALLDEAFGHFVEPHLIQPVFVIDHPVELSPLAKRHREVPGLTERFELIIAGMEFANAFSELNDPDDQRERFMAQLKLLELGDVEAQQLDEDFICALEYGMPPTGGLGVGIDRVTMLFTDQRSIRDVILFPTLRPEEGRNPE